MTAMATDHTVERARRLLKSAAKAVDQLEEDVRQLVAMRAWEVLGYTDFSSMWLEENGFECPTYVKVLGVIAMKCEGMNARNSGETRWHGPDGHTTLSIGKAIGFSTTEKMGKGGHSSAVYAILRQDAAGVSARDIVPSHNSAKRFPPIAEVRKPPSPRRIGRSYDELVSESFSIIRREADLVAEIARQADVPKAEIYRQAVAEYLMRYRASRDSSAAE